MSAQNIDDLTTALKGTRVSPSGISFASKSLKLDTEEDVKQITDEIDKCADLQFLNLEGNTFGVEACKGIGKALEKHPEFKRALWKDMFTGRMKSEIPQALEHLGHGLVTANAKLTELDLSDNAFGPIGVKGLAALLRSSSCYALEELRLNNNGLGISGGKLLASALTDCYNSSKKEGKPLALKVFIAGRNRLENDGAKALSAVFKMIGTLEEVAMPQNGIYFPGISALSEAFTKNKNLQIINLNDNTIGAKGAAAIAKALPQLQNLKELNFGDCLLKTKGALLLADALKTGHNNLEILNVEYNEIRIDGGIQVVKALSNKPKLKTLNLNGNQFGEEGLLRLEHNLKDIGKLNALGSMSGNESEASDEEKENDDSDKEEEEEEDEKGEDDEEGQSEEDGNDNKQVTNGVPSISVDQFLENPTVDNFIALGNARTEKLINKAMEKEVELKNFLPIIMKVSQLTETTKSTEVADNAFHCTEELYKKLFEWADESKLSSVTTNTLLEYTGLIKSEDKKLKPTWDQKICLRALVRVLEKPFVSLETKSLLRFFVTTRADLN